MKRVFVVALSAGAVACAGVPVAPAPRPTPEAWTQGGVERPAAEINDRYWRALGDPTLTALIEQAGDVDDVALAQARLDQARSGLRRARSALAPDLAVTGGIESAQSGDDVARIETIRGGASATWTLDIVGADRARSGAAQARVGSAEAELAAARSDVRRTIAELYIAVRDAQGRRRAAERTLASLTDTAGLARSRYDAGLVPELDVAQAVAAAAAAEARPPALAQAELSARLAMEALLGLSPGALVDRLSDAAPIPNAAPTLAALTPVEVLARRPDLLAAEYALVAAGLDARAARRDFWPRLSLSAFYGEQSVSPANPFLSDGLVTNAAASLAAPVLSFGRLESARDAADARLAEAAVRYRQAATFALTDVERALGAAQDAAARRDALARAQAAARNQATLARARYVAGLSPLFEVLTAERAVDDADATLSIAQADAALAFIALHARLGLGAETL